MAPADMRSVSALPSFPLVPDGYDPARVEAFIQRLIDRSKKEIGEARARSAQLEADLAEAYDVLKAADVRIRTLEMDLERVLEGFAGDAFERDTPPADSVDEIPVDEANDGPAEIVAEVVTEDVFHEEPTVPFTQPPPELSALEEKAAKAERAIRGRFLSSTKR